jgi:RHS repeat-associated protein
MLSMCLLAALIPSVTHAQAASLCVGDGGNALCTLPEVRNWVHASTNGSPCSQGGFDSEEAAKGFDLQCMSAPPVCSGSIVGVRSDWANNSGSFPQYPSTQSKSYDALFTYYSTDHPACGHSAVNGLALRRDRYVACPQGYLPNYGSNYCYQQRTPPPSCCAGNTSSDPGVGNPIHPSQGAKTQVETDYENSTGSMPLSLRRYYNSLGFFSSRGTPTPLAQFGYSWRSSFDRSLSTYTGTTNTIAMAYRPDGYVKIFKLSGSTWVPESDDADRLVQLSGGGWQYTSFNDEVETYDAQFKLVSIARRSGVTQTLTYSDATTPTTVAPSPGLLIRVADNFGRQCNFTYNSHGFVQSMADPTGATYQYAYDSIDNLVSVTSPDSQTRQYIYNELANTTSTNLPRALTGIIDEQGTRFATFKYYNDGRAYWTEHAGSVDKFTISFGSVAYVSEYKDSPTTASATKMYWFSTINGKTRVTSIAQPCASTCSGSAYSNITYDANGNISRKTDFNGNATTYQYDLARNLETSRTEAYGTTRARTITTQWNTSFRLPTLISIYNGGAGSGTPLRTTSFTYDANDNQLTKTIADPATSTSRTWTYAYNAYGQVLTADGPRTDVSDLTTYTYYTCNTGYQCGQLQTTIDALGHVTTYNTYNAHGQPLTMIDLNGVTTTLTYDLRQRLTSRTVGSELTNFDYWPTGLLKKVTLPDSSYLQYTYDAAHRLTQINDADGNKVVYTLDAMGNHTAESLYDPSNALARTHSRVFNSLNQLWKDVSATGTTAQTTVFGYDNNGNQTVINAPLTRNTTNQYDELNRLKQITDPASGVAKYGYDANDNLTSVIDPRNLTTSYTYSGLGDLKTIVSPDAGTTTNMFDSGGNVATSTNANSQVATFSRDALNRVTQIAYSDQTMVFNYDEGTNGIGHLTSLSDSSGSTSYTYTSQGRIASKTQIASGITKAVSYGYNSAGQLTSMTTPSGQAITYSYTNGKVTGIAVNGNSVLSNSIYDPFGPARQWMWGNGTYTNRTFDLDGKLTQVDSSGLNTYTFDDAFRITANTDTSNSANSWSYGYSLLDRLTSASKSSLSQSWTFDANGNRLTQGGTTSTTFIIASNSNRLTTTTGALARTYTFDSAGHPLSDGTRSFTYNAAGKMATATSGGVATTYSYNALGQRVKKSNTTGTTYFVYEDTTGQLLGQYDASGNLIEEIIYLGDIPVATLMPAVGGGVGFFYIHTDHLNTPTKITRPTDNAIVWRWDHDAYGNGTPDQDPDGNGQIVVFDLRGPGEVADVETGLLYNWNRYRDPLTGFLESDPIGLAGGSFSTYTFVGGNPVSYIDPYGLDRRDAQPGIGLPTPFPAFTPGTREFDDLAKAGTKAMDDLVKILNHQRDDESKPGNCPSGTVPIDEAKKKLGLDKDDVHGIKKGVNAGPKTWTGIAPNGDVWTGGPRGVGENHGPYGGYLP